ncbi:penicillin acylase family protein [Verrucosispora sp. CWR15]|uniref:Penicillin acylase family protein n=1 Tax=Verrucosispora sioxanthis TaxID=2499994 RepID=A0A6M1L879_9ACTN|nr:penicillin acylase family protein [Verrucosispora sioxanthis]NEE65323.1 penicillin acylase family protein [Verrucosispora sioxanthis]NGM14433.1 penicillin acylase family protein [Verrucosispora sioxanthis]
MTGHTPARRLLAGAATATAVAALLVATPTTAAPTTAAATTASVDSTVSTLTANAANDYCLGECSEILPPGQNGNATLVEILGNQAFGTLPRHSADQLGRYADLVYGYAGLREDQIDTFFHDASFGVAPSQVERDYSPRSDVRILRDRATGVPHITGTTRAGTMFGAGYAGAEDRLFTMDLLRHVGRGTLTPFAGGAPGNRALEQSVWRTSPYTEADLTAQVAALRRKGERGEQLYTDVQEYIAGINAYIRTCMANRNCPGEYVLTGHLDAITNAGGPEPFVLTDLVAIAGVVGGLFGGGGGTEMQSALVRIAARAKFGPVEGDRVWQGFRGQNDPETVLTLHDGQSFPYGDASPDAPSVVLPDAASARVEPVVTDPTGSATTTGSNSASELAAALSGLTIDPAHRGMSNAAVISAAHSTSGHPVAVFGPQTGYFSPQLLMVQELQGPGISARGAAFAGLNLYVLLGRGQDYAWSATSSVHDITDTYAVPLCVPGGGTPTLGSDHYLFRGQCLAMEELSHVNRWSPTVADGTAAGSYKLVAWRTKLGLVAWRGTVGGVPHAFTKLRATYGREADSAIGFQMYNDPTQMGSAAAFFTSANNVEYAFNWFYVNSTESAYFNSGLNPLRASGSNPSLPMKAERAYEWQDFDPETGTARYAPASAHPQSANQDYYVSWNNKQAKDFGAADGNFSFGAVHRGDLLDKPVKAALAAGRTFDRASLTELVQRAGLTDLRGAEVLGELLRVLESQPVTDAALATEIARLKAWRQAGALRVETARGSRVYQHAEAIRTLDAWWPLLVRGMFRAPLGAELYQSLVNTLQVNESPSGHQQGDVSNLPSSANSAQTHKGSAFQYGWWGWVDKDLRAVLGDPVAGGPGRTFCGDGDLAACRQILLDTLRTAATTPATQTYPGDETCAAGDQWCADAIVQSPLGGIKHATIAWQNRPTYQQVVSFPARRGDDLTNLAAGRPVAASSSQLFNGAGRAVDGDLGTRWASSWSDNQWLRVDLGSVRQVGRVALAWEAAYARSYRVEVSTDGATWRSAWSTSTGDGGTDVVSFAPQQARYVRMYGLTRGTSYGFSLWEMSVYAQ